MQVMQIKKWLMQFPFEKIALLLYIRRGEDKKDKKYRYYNKSYYSEDKYIIKHLYFNLIYNKCIKEKRDKWKKKRE
jgi:hypothetical protein